MFWNASKKIREEDNMQNETLQIMEMVQSKQITPEEGAKLIEALKQKSDVPATKARWLKIMIQEKGQEKPSVNVKLPIGLIKLVSKFIPQHKMEALRGKGVDINAICSGDFLNELKGEPLIDIDEPGGDKVKILIE